MTHRYRGASVLPYVLLNILLAPAHAWIPHHRHRQQQQTTTITTKSAILRSSSKAPPTLRRRLRSPVLLAAAPSASSQGASPPAPPASTAAAARSLLAGWGVCGFLGILANAIARLAPIALQPLVHRDLSAVQWGAYVATMCFFAYTEGYRAFQKKFSPLVVQRALSLGSPTRPHAAHAVLAPFYCMGLLHSTRRRKIVSWSVSLGVAAVVGMVKRLPYPWRSIVDAGVVTGLMWGGASIASIYAKALRGVAPAVDPELP